MDEITKEVPEKKSGINWWLVLGTIAVVVGVFILFHGISAKQKQAEPCNTWISDIGKTYDNFSDVLDYAKDVEFKSSAFTHKIEVGNCTDYNATACTAYQIETLQLNYNGKTEIIRRDCS